MAVRKAAQGAAYGSLLARTRPAVIRSEAENERLTRELEKLDSLGRPLKSEERELAELLTVLIGEFERSRYPLGHAPALDALKILMEDRGLRQRDLIPVFGSSSVTSNVLNGKRAISKNHARRLAEFFSVPVSLFL